MSGPEIIYRARVVHKIIRVPRMYSHLKLSLTGPHTKIIEHPCIARPQKATYPRSETCVSIVCDRVNLSFYSLLFRSEEFRFLYSVAVNKYFSFSSRSHVVILLLIFFPVHVHFSIYTSATKGNIQM